jgi:predicted O-methyltransferase YrrM
MILRDLELFLSDNSTPEDPVLEDLYRQTHIRFVNPNMVSGHIQGKLLEFLSRMINPGKILEIGTYTGYSAICLAKGLRPGGTLYTIESNDELSEFSRSYFIKAGVDSSIVQLTGRAQDIVPELHCMFDLVYIDGGKREYCDYYSIVKNKTKSGGFIIADNVLWGNKVLGKNSHDPQTAGISDFIEMIRSQNDVEKIIIPVRDGLMLIRKI